MHIIPQEFVLHVYMRLYLPIWPTHTRTSSPHRIELAHWWVSQISWVHTPPVHMTILVHLFGLSNLTNPHRHLFTTPDWTISLMSPHGELDIDHDHRPVVKSNTAHCSIAKQEIFQNKWSLINWGRYCLDTNELGGYTGVCMYLI